MNNLVVLKREIPVTTSKIIAEQTNVQHHTVTKLIQTHQKRLEKFGRVRFKIDTLVTKGGNQETKIYELNEIQATVLVTFMKNTDIVADFKVELVRQFYEMRQLLMQKSTFEWQQSRQQVISFTKLVNDTIKIFVEYAISQGSQNANRYYTSIQKLANKSVGITDGQRDMSSILQLQQQALVLNIIKTTIEDGISSTMPYKSIYQLCKERLENIMSYVRINTLQQLSLQSY